jgi:2-polyprenyl-3-methyl-5-hydroxy-6-metoxy-1,4-benzoquinol methylase
MTYAEWSDPDRTPRSKDDFLAIRRTLLFHSPFLRERFDFRALRGKDVLEIGCGSGVTACLLAEGGAKVTAVDITQTAVDMTEAAATQLGVDVAVSRMDAETLDFPDGTFDFVFSWGVLHHSKDTDRAFAEAARTIKPGGGGLFMVYHTSSIVYWLKGLYWLLLKGKILQGYSLKTATDFYCDGYYHRHFTRRQLRESLTAAGFDVDRIVVTQMQKPILPLLPKFLDEWLKDRVGWLIVGEVTKRADR